MIKTLSKLTPSHINGGNDLKDDYRQKLDNAYDEKNRHGYVGVFLDEKIYSGCIVDCSKEEKRGGMSVLWCENLCMCKAISNNKKNTTRWTSCSAVVGIEYFLEYGYA